MRRPWRIAAAVAFLVALVLGGLAGDRVLALTDEARDALRLYTEIVTVAQERYGAEISYQDVVYASVQGMLRTLDPHSYFLSPEAYADMREKQQSSFYGLGIWVGMRQGRLTVITPIDGTPASRRGLRAGDVISSIDGDSTETMTIDEAVQKLKGPKGTEVLITIVRKGLAEPLEIGITRDEIPQNTVRLAYIIGPGTGYLSLSDFNRASGEEVARAIEDLKEKGMKRLLLDLRTNGGGLLDQAIAVTDQFVPKGSEVVQTRGRIEDSFQEFEAPGTLPELGMPLIILVGTSTASAAEIVAGAVQDHDMGLIVGETTWGKGLVQTVYGLSYGAALALTTAKYYTPSGRLIQRDYTSWFEYQLHAGAGEPGDEPAFPPEGERAPDEPIGQPDRPEREVFRTDLGRRVYGGGGITPDVFVETKEIAPFLQYLLARNAFFDYAVDYVGRHRVASETWEPPDDLLAGFATWLADEEIATLEEAEEALADPENGAYIRRQIHAEIFNSVFGLEARFQVLARGDRQIQEALGLFDRAAELLAARRELEKGEQRAERSVPAGAAEPQL